MIQEYLIILSELVKFVKSRTIHFNKLLNYMENIQQWSEVESPLFVNQLRRRYYSNKQMFG